MTQEDSIQKIIDYLSKLQSQLDEVSLSKEANNVDHIIEQPSASFQGEEKKPSSCWVRVRGRIYNICKAKKKVSSNASDDGGSQGGSKRSSDKDQVDADLEIQKMRSDIRQMKDAFENLKKFQTSMSKSLAYDLSSDKLRAILKGTKISRSSFHDLKEIRRKILNLKCQIPSLLYKESSSGGLSITDSQTAEEYDQINETENDIYLPGLHVSIDRQDPTAFEEVVEKFQGLEFTEKLCLLSFAVFPENKEVKRTMLMYWWIGEGFIVCDDPEKAVATILKNFSSKGLLEPVEDEKKLSPSSYKMEPHVHSAVIYLTKYMELFNLYNSKGKLTMQKSKKEKVCLVKNSSLQKEAKTSKMEPKSLKTVFNSSERYPDFTFKWFLKMDSLRVLYLGRWERTPMRHIEVESTEFLKNMKNLKNLKLVSFQGISRIEKLHKSICDLPKLVILDLRACYNLEALPSDIGSLDKLIYLDVSECYMLDRMPEGIAYLKRLKVLKGFVISESEDEKNCAVKHLVELRKLSITVNKFLFKVENLMESLKNLDHLESLKIAWGARFSDKNKETMNKEENERGLATEETHKELKEREDDNVHEKGQTSEEKKGDDHEETKKQEVRQEDGVSSNKENGNGDGHNEKTNLEEGKKHEEIKAEESEFEEVYEGEKEASSSEESEFEGVSEGEKKASPSGESTKTTQNKLDDQKGKGKVEEEGDGDKEKADQDQGKKPDEAEAESSKSEKKTSVSKESTEVIQNQPEDQNKKDSVEEDGDKGKADLEDRKKQEEVEAEKSKSDRVVEGEKKANPSQESSDTNDKKLDDQSKVEEKGHEDKGKTDPVEEKKRDDEVESQKTKSDNDVKGVKEASPPQESKDEVKNKSNEKGEVGKEEDGDKDKVDPEKGKTQHEIEREKSKSDNGDEGAKKADLSRESTNMIQNKPDDHQKHEKQEEKGDSEKEKLNLEEGKKNNEVNAQSAKPDKVTPQESKDTIQSNTNEKKDNSKVQEKEDGVKDVVDSKKLDEGEVKTQKSDKSKKLGKKVSFSEEPIATIQKKPEQRAKTMAEEIHETASPSRPEKIASTKSGSSIPKLSKGKGNESKRWGRIWHEEIDTSKLPSSLKKLELECFPEPDPPVWLNPKNLDNLQKLSIKGGKLSKISDDELPTAENNCGVQILRLKYLHEFKAEWNELQALFPQMILLEKYKCPKVAFCPTDGNGVWKLQPQASLEMPK